MKKKEYLYEGEEAIPKEKIRKVMIKSRESIVEYFILRWKECTKTLHFNLKWMKNTLPYHIYIAKNKIDMS